MDMDFLKDTIDGVLDQAVEAVHGLIVTAQQVLDDVDSQLDDWADEIRSLADDAKDGGSDEVTPQSMYDYLTQNSSGSENAHYNSARSFLLSDYGRDALESLYESKKREERVPFDFDGFDWPDDDWWAGKTDKY